MEAPHGNAITSFMNKLLDEYAHIRGKPKDSYLKPFWDVVVITTVDKAQQEAFQLQVEGKVKRQELPSDLPVHVISDPPGIRIGNGGSALAALEELEALYGPELFTKKILLIPSGGWSQRMPSASILGKVFAVLPHGQPPYQMLDLKLALYWPLVERMQPGVFLACADDFVLYSLPSKDEGWKIPGQGFTALAHPSPIHVGRTHGVYVLPNPEKLDTQQEVIVSSCLKVLQKNDDERMEAQGAVLHGEDHCFADGIHIKGKAVYTDSSFYFGTDVMRKLISFKKNVGDLPCEIDAYGDFLQAVGVNATNDYLTFTANVRQKNDKLIATRQSVFDCLNGTDIHILVLNASLFVHIGTTKELLHHFCEDEDFQKKMAFKKDVFNAWIESTFEKANLSSKENLSRDDSKVSGKSCIMHSAIHVQSEISHNNVIEYCDFEAPVHLKPNCIMSNCQIQKSDLSQDGIPLEIPTAAFIHTVPILPAEDTKYVTVFFHIEDNLKKALPVDKLEELPFWGSTVGSFLKVQGLALEDILPQDCRTNKENSDNFEAAQTARSLSLWDLKLYPASDSMTTSLEDALTALHGNQRVQPSSLFSLADLLVHKNVRGMLDFRKHLYEKIKQYH